ncbi:MAG: class I SAM-dependent methyltransferase [Gemmatimonadetes bacterium]|nr:class I SAM-dependent methyltransferase [Gemmatimonadota bacterium]
MLSQSDLYCAFDTAPDTVVAFLTRLMAAESRSSIPHLADIGAGPGRLIPPLAALGWSVTAYEPDPDYLPAAETTVRNCPNVIVRQGGFEDLAEVDAFDLVCGINSSYAYLLSPSRRAPLYVLIACALRRNGFLILDLPNFPWIPDHYRAPVPQDGQWEGRRIVRHRQHQIDRERGTFTTIDRDVISDSSGEPTACTKVHVYAIVDHSTHLAELAAAGFTDVRLFPSFEARAPVPVPASRLISVARQGTAA